MTTHDKQRQRFEELVSQRRRELGHEPPREDVRAILNQIDRERRAKLEAMLTNADAELDANDLAILDAMGDDTDEPAVDEPTVDEPDEGPS